MSERLIAFAAWIRLSPVWVLKRFMRDLFSALIMFLPSVCSYMFCKITFIWFLSPHWLHEYGLSHLCYTCLYLSTDNLKQLYCLHWYERFHSSWYSLISLATCTMPHSFLLVLGWFSLLSLHVKCIRQSPLSRIYVYEPFHDYTLQETCITDYVDPVS